MLEYFSYACEILLLINIIILLFAPNRKVTYHILLAYLLFVFTIQVYSHWLRNLGQNNLYLSHLLFPGQCVLLNCFCYFLLQEKRLKRALLSAMIILWSIALAYITLSPETFYAFNEVEILTSNLSVIIALLLFLYDSMGKKRPLKLTVMGLLIYFMGSTVIFISGNLIVKLGASTAGIWLLNVILFLLLQLIIMVNNIKQLKMTS